MEIRYEWRGAFDNDEVNLLHAEGFDHQPTSYDWWTIVNAHSLGWLCARARSDLVGFVNVAWDGSSHAFLLDTVVATRARHGGIGRHLVQTAARHARESGCEWLHVDFDDDLRSFYLNACGFTATPAGVLRLRDNRRPRSVS